MALRLDRRCRHPGSVCVAVVDHRPERRHAGAVRRAAPAGALTPPLADTVLHRTDRGENVRCLCVRTPVYVRLRIYRRQERSRPQSHAAAAGHSPVGSGAGISLHHSDRVPGAFSREPARGRVREHLRHLYRAGVEHDVRLLPLAHHHPRGAAGSGVGLQAQSLAAVHQGRAPVVGDRPDVELDDELWRRLVLRRAKRSHLGVEQDYQAARSGTVHDRCRRRAIRARPCTPSSR